MEDNKLSRKDIRLNKYQEYDEELNDITAKMNDLCDELAPLKEKYYKIMCYFRTQLNRGLITREEYEERANLFKYKK